MNIKIIEVLTQSASIRKELIFKCELSFSNKMQLPLVIEGILISDGNKILADIKESPSDNTRGAIPLMPKNDAEQVRDQTQEYRTTISVNLVAVLSREAILHIEQKRLSNNQKDVVLSLKLRSKYLNTGFDTTKFTQTLTDLIRYDVTILYADVKIPQSDWLKKFSDDLGIGSFLIIEINKSKMLNLFNAYKKLGEDDLEDFTLRIEKTIDKINIMENHIKTGEWEIVMRFAREFFELLRFKKADPLYEKFKTRFIDRNGTDVGFLDLYKATQGLFEYSSKFIHEKDKQGKMHVKPIAKMEDAYFTFSLCVNVLHLIIGKV